MAGERAGAPDGTAVRVALWRAMHVLLDPPPHVLEDEIGLRLAALLDDRDRSGLQASRAGAHASGTPFVSFYTPPEMLALAYEAGFQDARHVPGSSLTERYFAGRRDGLRPSSGEDLLVATT